MGVKKGASKCKMSPESVEKHKLAFEAIAGDPEADGKLTLTKDELSECLPNVPGEHLDAAFEKADTDNSGCFTLDEWLDFCWASYIEEANKILDKSDVNDDNKLTKDEVAAAFSSNQPPLSSEEVDKIMAMFDASGDGKITRDELMDFLSGANEDM